MKIAILGAGFAGLVTAWHLYQLNPSLNIHLFDPSGIAGGSSGLSSGLLHPYSGLHARCTWNTHQAIDSTKRLLDALASNYSFPIYKQNGVLRPAVTLEQVEDFQTCAKKYSDAIWLDVRQCREKIDSLHCLGGLFIPSGILVDVTHYFEALFEACLLHGLVFHRQKINSIEEIEEFDVIVGALGSATKQIKGFDHIPINCVKGQIIELEWPKNEPPLPHSLVGLGYLIQSNNLSLGLSSSESEGFTPQISGFLGEVNGHRPFTSPKHPRDVSKSPEHKGVKPQTQVNNSCIAGATYERKYENVLPDPEYAANEIRKKVASFLPFLENAPILDCKSGLRASAMNSHLPIVDQISSKLWCFTALGSKGLLYHSFLASFLAQAILSNNPFYIPKELRLRACLKSSIG